MLRTIIPERDVSTVLALAINLATYPCPLGVHPVWYENTVTRLKYPRADMKPGKILQLLQDLGDQKILGGFSSSYTSQNHFPDVVGFIVRIDRLETSQFLKEYCPPVAGPVSEYYLFTCNPEQGVIYGARRLNDRFRAQVNILTQGIPLINKEMPVIFPEGSIRTGHLSSFAASDISFVLPLPPFRVFNKESIKSLTRSLLSDINFRTLNNEPVFIRASPVRVGSEVISGFLILNTLAEKNAKLRMNRKLFQVNEDLKKVTPLREEYRLETAGDIFPEFSPFIKVSENSQQSWCTLDRLAISHAAQEAGMLLVLHRGGIRREECIALLYERRIFDDLLSDRIRALTQILDRNLSERMMEGVIFIAMLAAALRWRIFKMLPRIKGRASLSVDGLMTVLSPITVLTGPGRTREVSGITRATRAVLNELNCDPAAMIPGCDRSKSG